MTPVKDTREIVSCFFTKRAIMQRNIFTANGLNNQAFPARPNVIRYFQCVFVRSVSVPQLNHSVTPLKDTIGEKACGILIKHANKHQNALTSQTF